MLTIARVVLMVIWTALYGSSFHLFRIVPKMIQRSVSFQLFWWGSVRNIDCSDAIQVFAPFFRPVMVELACMKYFIVLEAVKNRRIDSLFVDLSRKLFGNVMMLLPWQNTMPGFSRSLECHVNIGIELLKFLSDGKHFIRHVQFSPAWTYLKYSFNVWISTLTLYFVSYLLNFM